MNVAASLSLVANPEAAARRWSDTFEDATVEARFCQEKYRGSFAIQVVVLSSALVLHLAMAAFAGQQETSSYAWRKTPFLAVAVLARVALHLYVDHGRGHRLGGSLFAIMLIITRLDAWRQLTRCEAGLPSTELAPTATLAQIPPLTPSYPPTRFASLRPSPHPNVSADHHKTATSARRTHPARAQALTSLRPTCTSLRWGCSLS